ncbi:MAG: hypothetical protein ACREUU_06990 [Gammaproteobacteria bacterium]
MIGRQLGILMTALLLTGSARAADNAATHEQPDQPPAVQEKEAEPEKPSTEEQAGVTTPDTFTPSEEISEDLSVPFPVDI